MKRNAKALVIAAGSVAVLGAGLLLLPAPASADMRSLLLGRAGTKNVGAGVFEVTARGNNMREKRSSLEVATMKAAKRAAQEKGSYFAILREKTGSWTMGGRRIGDETTLKFKVMSSPDPITDEAGTPARVFKVADLLPEAK